jgi:GNAT superfamily N-acetyltransferase
VEGLSSPRLLTINDDLSSFDCGIPDLNNWLANRAKFNHRDGASRSYVVTSGAKVAAFYCLAAGSINHLDAPGSIRRNMPDPVPVIIMGRLATDLTFQGRGLGSALVLNAIDRTAALSQHIGIRALLVHAKDDAAANFYRKHNFKPSPHNGLLLLARV